uniref:Uncharacterized protein n=1 Tax=Candidatus Kentrum sp. SD TaxID=2126332 RepID=A0A451BRX3_9GAMM|nr:MAG: hypothetical protein BECKSD772F_GA0070984_11269 [Candidatus Kentron sp. SD]VFK49576.1 MAG: hypothetical protein BECKSD772E_GA0070983_11932 [Candidatus Kentron sp. SD]VFK81051.1 MAG: hypothetical protein BECKSD772D_GA0070982_12082 [Candidatus Kentron sp. SD]
MRKIVRSSESDKKTYPPWIVSKMLELDDNLKFKNNSRTKITDFLELYMAIWSLSSKPYQKKYWGIDSPESVDNYSETMEEFLGTGRAVLDTSDYAVEMTSKQREMLQKLYDMMEDFEWDDDTADDPGYGINDHEIIEDPKFDKCRKYARLVYEELSGDDLDAWEKARTAGE